MQAATRKAPLFAFRRGERGWLYLGRAAAWMQHGGWVHLSAAWLKRFALRIG